MEIFNIKAVRKMIDFKWPLAKSYTIWRLFVPFIFFLAFYLAYMNVVYYKRNVNASWALTNQIFIGFLCFFCLYFINNERRQLMAEGFDYLLSIWNYLDLIPPILLFVFIPLEYIGTFDNGQNATLEACLQATMSLVLWLKFLYFLRIFEATGYLIKIIIEVFIDMRFFLMILLLTFVAFGDALRSISSVNPPDSIDDLGQTVQYQFITTWFDGVMFVYRMVLGDFDTTAFGVVAVPYVWILFILCTLFNMIIMLNLLIAIISESFARINEVSDQAAY